jgi:hypothetical protein
MPNFFDIVLRDIPTYDKSVVYNPTYLRSFLDEAESLELFRSIVGVDNNSISYDFTCLFFHFQTIPLFFTQLSLITPIH